MRHRPQFIAVVWMVVLSVLVSAGPAAAQVTVQKRYSSSQERDMERIRELSNEIEELMKQLPPDVQADLRKELRLAPTTVTPVGPVGPVSPVKVDLKDADEGDIAANGATEFMALDLRGNDLDLGGRATIRVGGSDLDTNWTRPNTDDAFLMIDAVTLRAAGFELTGADGVSVQNRVLISDGVRLRMPDGNEVVSTDPWQLLGQFDTNKDGKVNPSDVVWQHLNLFVDANGDGRVMDGELQSIAHSVVRDISLRKGSSRRDSHGNMRTDGTFRKTDGTTRTAAGVRLRRH